LTDKKALTAFGLRPQSCLAADSSNSCALSAISFKPPHCLTAEKAVKEKKLLGEKGKKRTLAQSVGKRSFFSLFFSISDSFFSIPFADHVSDCYVFAHRGEELAHKPW